MVCLLIGEKKIKTSIESAQKAGAIKYMIGGAIICRKSPLPEFTQVWYGNFKFNKNTVDDHVQLGSRNKKAIKLIVGDLECIREINKLTDKKMHI